MALYGAGEYANALPLFEEAAERFKQAADVESEARVRHDMGRCRASLGKHQDALNPYSRALALLLVAPATSPGARLSCHVDLALTFNALGRNWDAIRHTRTAIDLLRARHTGDHPEIAAQLDNLAFSLAAGFTAAITNRLLRGARPT